MFVLFILLRVSEPICYRKYITAHVPGRRRRFPIQDWQVCSGEKCWQIGVGVGRIILGLFQISSVVGCRSCRRDESSCQRMNESGSRDRQNKKPVARDRLETRVFTVLPL